MEPVNEYRHPQPGWFGKLVEKVANAGGLARIRRAVFSRLPFPVLRSDVEDVVYLTWLVPVERCSHLVPPDVVVWSHDGLTPFSILSYRHRHFGPALAGPLRRLLPSPYQSNWRLYLKADPDRNVPAGTVLFVRNVMDNLFYTLGTRVCSDALPTHLAAKFVHSKTDKGYSTRIESGIGSAPTLISTLHPEERKVLPPRFRAIFGDWSTAVKFLACQDGAIAPCDHGTRLAYSGISLPIPLDRVVPAVAEYETDCPMLADLAPIEEPFCFVVPKVTFHVLSERLLPPASSVRGHEPSLQTRSETQT